MVMLMMLLMVLYSGGPGHLEGNPPFHGRLDGLPRHNHVHQPTGNPLIYTNLSQ